MTRGQPKKHADPVTVSTILERGERDQLRRIRPDLTLAAHLRLIARAELARVRQALATPEEA